MLFIHNNVAILFRLEGGELKVTLNELLKVVNDNTRIQIRLKMFGSTFSTNRYKNYLLNDEKKAKLLALEVETVWTTEDEDISTLVVSLK